MGAAPAAAVRRVHQIEDAFKAKGAISQATALPLDLIGAPQCGMLELMRLRGHIHETNGNYWLDTQAFDDRAIKKLHNLIGDIVDDLTE